MKTLLVLIFSFCFSQTFSQWEKVTQKTTFVYAYYSYEFKYKEVDGAMDTLSKKREPDLYLTIDTVLNLSGKGRKLVVFSECIDSIFIGKRTIILNGKLEDQPKDKNGIIDLSGYSTLPKSDSRLILDYSWTSKPPEKLRSSIIYQVGSETYLITTPKSFFNTYMHNPAKMLEFDKALLKLNVCKDCEFPLITDGYLFIKDINISLPIRPFIELDKNIKFIQPDVPLDAEPGQEFYSYKSSIYNKVFRAIANCYSVDRRKYLKKDIYLINGIGITREDYREDGDDGISADGDSYELIKTIPCIPECIKLTLRYKR